MRFSNPLAILLLSASLSHATELLASDIQPPASVPQPSWVSMVDQRGTDARLAGYLTPREIKLEIVAQNPALTHAGDSCFGADGSLFLLEWRPGAEAGAREFVETLNYRDGSRHSFKRMSTPVKDAIKIVRNLGSFDEAQVILEQESISCILRHGDWLYTAGAGSVCRYRRSRNEGPFDVKETVARGFGGLGQRPAFGLAVDFDGALLIAVGPGNHEVEGSDGSRARAARSGAIFRSRPDGSRLEVLAIGLSLPSGGPAFDKEFHAFQIDGASAGEAASRRLLQIAEASDFGFRSACGLPSGADDLPRRDCLRGLPGVMTPIYSNAPGQSGGMCIYNDTLFPPLIQGLLLCPDPDQHCIRALHAERRDSSFAISEAFDLVRSRDPLFQPCQIMTGPDGAMYLRDRAVQTVWPGQPVTPKREGRLYRLSWTGGPAHPGLPLRSLTSWSRFAGQGGADLIKSLGSADFSDRLYAQQELIRRAKINKAKLLGAVGNADLELDARMLAAGALSTVWDEEVKNALINLASDDEALLRRIAAECLGRNGSKKDLAIQEALLHLLGDPDPSSRRAIALAMAKVAAPEAADCLATTLSFDIGGDLYLRDGLVRSLEMLGKPGLERLLALANSGEETWLELAVESFCALRLPVAIELLPQLLGNPHLQTEQRVRLVRSLARYQVARPRDLLPIFRYFAAQPPHELEVWTALIEVLAVQYLNGAGGMVHLIHLLDELAAAN